MKSNYKTKLITPDPVIWAEIKRLNKEFNKKIGIRIPLSEQFINLILEDGIEMFKTKSHEENVLDLKSTEPKKEVIPNNP